MEPAPPKRIPFRKGVTLTNDQDSDSDSDSDVEVVETVPRKRKDHDVGLELYSTARGECSRNVYEQTESKEPKRMKAASAQVSRGLVQREILYLVLIRVVNRIVGSHSSMSLAERVDSQISIHSRVGARTVPKLVQPDAR